MQLRESLWLKVEDGLAAPLGTHSDTLKHVIPLQQNIYST